MSVVAHTVPLEMDLSPRWVASRAGKAEHQRASIQGSVVSEGTCRVSVFFDFLRLTNWEPEINMPITVPAEVLGLSLDGEMFFPKIFSEQ